MYHVNFNFSTVLHALTIFKDTTVGHKQDILLNDTRPASMPTVAIFLGTYNGACYLAQQLDSLMAQDYPHWFLCVSDDGSNDGTVAILKRYQQAWGDKKLLIFSGPSRGCTANFLTLTCDQSIQADYYAYADQDDIWHTEKLQRAINYLVKSPADAPTLYCSRTKLVDEHNHDLGVSRLFNKAPSFAHALVQNIAGGNTMVFNQALRNILCEAGPHVDVIVHDWWVYLAASACGGNIFYDPMPSLRYRQHSVNVIGMNPTWSARLARLGRLHKRDYKHEKNLRARQIAALSSLRTKMTKQNRDILDCFLLAQQSALLPRLMGLKKAGVYRQTLRGNVTLLLEIIFNIL